MKEELKKRMIAVIGTYSNPLIESVAEKCAQVAIDHYKERESALSMSDVEDSAVDFSRPLKQCMAGRDGECNHPNCPVSEKDVENGIYCQLPLIDWRE